MKIVLGFILDRGIFRTFESAGQSICQVILQSFAKIEPFLEMKGSQNYHHSKIQK